MWGHPDLKMCFMMCSCFRFRRLDNESINPWFAPILIYHWAFRVYVVFCRGVDVKE